MPDRRPLIPAPAEGPYWPGASLGAPEPTRSLGGYTELSLVPPRPAPPVRFSPEPFAPAHLLRPQTYQHPYGQPYHRASWNMGRATFPPALASHPVGEGEPVPLRTNYRRPSLAEPGSDLP